MNGNSSKQALLSVLGIAVLVVAVVGVSFAFFSYSKNGNTNNTIATGQIYTYLTEGTEMSVTNAFPQKTAPAFTTTGTTDVGHLQFSVTGVNESQETITYKVYILEGTAPTITTGEEPNQTTRTPSVRLRNSEVTVVMTESGHSTGTVTNALATAKDMQTLTSVTGNNPIATGVEIATGTFPTGSNETHTYHLNMYVNGTVTISDTDLSVNGTAPTYCAHATEGNPQNSTATGNYGCELYMDGTTLKKLAKNEDKTGKNFLPAYSDAYYAVKIRVVANTQAGQIAP